MEKFILKKYLTKGNITPYNRVKLMKDSLQPVLQQDSGLVLVSTGVWKLEKPSVAGHYVKSSN